MPSVVSPRSPIGPPRQPRTVTGSRGSFHLGIHSFHSKRRNHISGHLAKDSLTQGWLILSNLHLSCISRVDRFFFNILVLSHHLFLCASLLGGVECAVLSTSVVTKGERASSFSINRAFFTSWEQQRDDLTEQSYPPPLSLQGCPLIRLQLQQRKQQQEATPNK